MVQYTDDEGSLLLIPRSSNGAKLRESDARAELSLALAEATILDLRLELQERNWLRLGEDGAEEFDRATIGIIAADARAYYLKNPLIRRAVQVATFYVWGQDLSRKATDPNVQKVIDRFWADNQATLTGQQASRLLEVERMVTGNLFLALFSDSLTGQVRVRMVPFEQIKEIVTNRDDRAEPWYYLREWPQKRPDGTGTDQMAAFYPDWRYRPEDLPDSYQWQGREIPVRKTSPICHDKSGAFAYWLWGVPPVYAALAWARAYKQMLENDATRSAALARYVHKVTTSGGAQGVAAAKARIASTLGRGSPETNPAPAAGSSFIRGSKDQDVEAVDISKAIMPPDHSRNARLMVASAVGLSDTILSGDVDQSSLATATSLDRPTHLQFTEMRHDRIDTMEALCQYVIDRDIEAPRGLITGTLTEEQRKVELSWPDLLETDKQADINALVNLATLGGREPAGTLSQETVTQLGAVRLGVKDIDAELVKVAAEKIERERKAAEIAQQTQQQEPPEPGQPPQRQQEADVEREDDLSREAFVAALKDVREALVTR